MYCLHAYAGLPSLRRISVQCYLVLLPWFGGWYFDFACWTAGLDVFWFKKPSRILKLGGALFFFLFPLCWPLLVQVAIFWVGGDDVGTSPFGVSGAGDVARLHRVRDVGLYP